MNPGEMGGSVGYNTWAGPNMVGSPMSHNQPMMGHHRSVDSGVKYLTTCVRAEGGLGGGRDMLGWGGEGICWGRGRGGKGISWGWGGGKGYARVGGWRGEGMEAGVGGSCLHRCWSASCVAKGLLLFLTAIIMIQLDVLQPARNGALQVMDSVVSHQIPDN